MRPVWHPMVLRHPVTGRKSLVYQLDLQRCRRRLDAAAARRLIEDLSAFAPQPKFMYRHEWQPHDGDVGQPLHRPRRHAARSADAASCTATTIVGREDVMAG